jgi:hypothetical protein
MLTQFKKNLNLFSLNAFGWSTKRRIVVIESDDWGSIRMPSFEVYETLLKNNINVNKSSYCKYDNLATADDLEKLYEILTSFKDIHGNHPVFTANTVVANPDFEKIEQSNFSEYYFEPFTFTLKRYPKHQNAFKLWQEGIQQKIFFPQFHGREHLNVELWMRLLQEDNKDFKLAFKNRMWGLSNEVFPNMSKNVQATFDSHNDEFLKKSIESGLTIFKDIFGYKSLSFIANNYTYRNTLNETLANCEVKYIQGMRYQLIPVEEGEPKKKVWNYCGKKNKYNQTYLVRNCSFEPSVDSTGFNETIEQISNSFFCNKPAIIGSHRINYIGNLVPENSSKNLKQLFLLLKTIQKKWPDVEFMNSVELGNLITKNAI